MDESSVEMVTVRPYRAGDESGVLELVERVFGVSRDPAWFAWKFESNPYVDHVPIVVATVDDEIVGVRPFLALRMAIAGRSHLALQPVDAMVHPDYRRRGIFTAMTEYALERYEGSDATLCFNFPNAAAAAGNRQLGWTKVGDRGTLYRFASPASIAADHDLPAGVQAAAAAMNPASSGYNALRSALAPDVDDVPVEHIRGVPARALEARYQEAVPRKIHAVRDETFYDWRFRNPDWRYETYLVDAADEPGAAMVVGRSVDDGDDSDGKTLKLTDILPVDGTCSRTTIAALLDRVLDDHSDAALVVAPPVPTVREVVADFGFLCDRAYPLRAFATPTRLYARPLGEDWTIEGIDVRDPDNWALTFAEHDTS